MKTNGGPPAHERGVNEFYADCRLDTRASASPMALLPRVLTRVLPLRAEAGMLVVEATAAL